MSRRNSPSAYRGWRRPRHLRQGEDAQPERKLWQFSCQDTVKIEDFSLEQTTIWGGFFLFYCCFGECYCYKLLIFDRLSSKVKKAICILQRQHAGRSKGFAPKERGKVSKHEDHIFSVFPSSTFSPIVTFRNKITAFIFFFNVTQLELNTKIRKI